MKIFTQFLSFYFSFLLSFLCFFSYSLSCFFSNLYAQNAQDYIFPIKSKPTQAYLAGNMGEIRGQHFHLGFDIGAMTGTEVMAVADGYVEYVEVSPVSYGKLLIIFHPSTNQKTLYAHLDDFAGEIGDFVRKTQFLEKKTEVKINFSDAISREKKEILVKKGQVIAYIGNTGVSGGAHLHFEIRDKNNVALNPASFNFQEVPRDNLPPNIKKIAITPFNHNSRVESEFLRYTFIPEKTTRGTYIIKNPIKISGEVGLEVFAEDIIPNSPHTFSIQKMELYLGEKTDENLQFVCNLQKIDNSKNRMMLAHINTQHQNPKEAFQKCYLSDGNSLENYPVQKNKGKIKLHSDEKMPFTLVLTDAWGNQSTLTGVFLGESAQKNAVIRKNTSPNTAKNGLDNAKNDEAEILYEVHENLLKISTKNIKQLPENAFLTFKGMRQNTPKSYQINDDAVYIWDLRDGLPDGVEIGAYREPLYFRKTIYPIQKDEKNGEKTAKNTENVFEMDFLSDEENNKLYDKIKLIFRENSLFDTLYLSIQPFNSGFYLGDDKIPLWQNINVQYFLANDNLFGEKSIFYFGNAQAIPTKIEKKQGEGKGNLSFDTRKFGFYKLGHDQIPPMLKLVSKTPQYVRLYAEDKGENLVMGSGIASYKATLNGNFALLEYEPKEQKLFIRQPIKEPPLVGDLEVKIQDLAGNEQVLRVKL